MGKRILAVFAGWFVWGVVSQAVYAALLAALPSAFGAAGVPQGTGLLLGLIVLAFAYSWLAGWCAARIDPGGGTRTLQFLAGALVLTGIAVQASVWAAYPLWFHVAFVLVLTPGALLGGRRKGSATPAAAHTS